MPLVAGASAFGGVVRSMASAGSPFLTGSGGSSDGITVSTPADPDPDIFAAVLPVDQGDADDAEPGDGDPGDAGVTGDDQSDDLEDSLTEGGLPVGGDWEFVDDEGEVSDFHVSTQGVDFSEPWGVLFWFEGDGTISSASTIPDSQQLSSLADTAAAHNMVFVVPDTPDSADPTDVTWWKDYDGNGAWFRALETVLVGTWDVDTTRVWFTGYSGGADFISTELLPSGNDWIEGGGAVLIGGGESPDTGADHTDAMTSMPLTWFVGADDGEIDSDDWSPLRVAMEGRAAWRDAGFTDTSLVVLPGLGHTDYDPAELVGRALDAAGVTG